MPDLESSRQSLADAVRRQEQLAAQLAGASGALAAARARLAAAQASGDRDSIEAASGEIRDLVQQRTGSVRALGELHERARLDLESLLGTTLDLEGDIPLVLLPVRIETRSTPGGASLRVRIFHDALHCETLDEGLTEAERAAGIAYWSAVWSDGDPQALWPALVQATGQNRAAWVAEALRPTNLAGRPNVPPEFPDTPAKGGRPAVARTLPDRFYIRVEQDGAAPVTVHGSAIPDELPIGLTDRDELTVLDLDGQDLPPIDESLRWLVDYAEAERVGMAVTVPLPLPGRPVRRLVAYGVRAALDPLASAARIDRLIRSHRFTDGAEFVAQGTPTNNTESVRTEWSRRTPPGAPRLEPPASVDPGTNGAVTAAALGVSPSLLATLPRAADAEQSRAAAFNTALWTTTWGDAIEHLTPAGRAYGDRRLDNPSLDAVRDHWVEHVRGRGPLPLLRLGRQPYGLLPVVATDASWRPLRGGFVEDRLIPFIHQQIRWMWDDAVPSVPTIMNTPLDTALPEILGTDAVLRGLRVRTALSPDPVMYGAMALTLPDLGNSESRQQAMKALLVLSGVPDDALDEHHLLGTKTRTLSLPLVHDSDPDFVTGLLQPDPPPMPHRSVLQVLLAHADAVQRHQRSSFASAEMTGLLRSALGESRVELDRDLVVQGLDAVLEQGVLDSPIIAHAAAHVTERVGRLDTRLVADQHPIRALAPATLLQQVAGDEPNMDRLRGEVGMQLIGELFHGARWAARFREALRTIAAIESLEERRLLLAETLDCCSHRLDAWISAAASRRLGDLRTGGARGAFLGAYGWLENIELQAPRPAEQLDGRDVLHDGADGGYVHAPGLTHAAAAGVLRSGRLTHRQGDPNTQALDIDLSSTRTRDALSLLDGMRRGQSLGALLGYRLERRLHERSGGGLELDRFIYVLRTLAPLRGGKITDPGAPVEESLAASDVVDGLRLLDIPPGTIAAKLVAGPEDTRYIVPPDRWVPPGPGESEAVIAVLQELERTHDAVADLLLAESVYQLVSGNPARAAATLDVLGAGEAVPPEPEVVRTPRTGVPVQYRVAIVVHDPLPPPVPGWDATSPRAQAEPRLEAWAQGALGDPAEIPVTPDGAVTLAYAGVSALDVLYDADGDTVGASTLVARLRSTLSGRAELSDNFSALAPIWTLAGLLRAMLLGGRPLEVADVGRPVEEHATGRLPDAAELLNRAKTATAALKIAAMSADPLPTLARFGVRPPAKGGTQALTPAEQSLAEEALIVEAGGRVRAAEELLGRAEGPVPVKTAVELSMQALAAIFGGGFVAVPLLLPPPSGEADLWAGAVGPGGVRARPGADIRPWLARAGACRAKAYAYGEALLVRDALGRTPLLRVVQSPAGAYDRWVGLPFPEGRPPMAPVASMVAEIAGAKAGETEPPLKEGIAGIVVDEWTEVVPRRRERRDPKDPDAEPELVDVTTTGLAVNANAPGARPPQAILLALSADGGRWNGERLERVLEETLALARMRTVTLQSLPYAGLQLPALYFHDWSLQGEPVLDWLQVATEFTADNAIKYLAMDS
jgi:hypothetical protein